MNLKADRAMGELRAERETMVFSLSAGKVSGGKALNKGFFSRDLKREFTFCKERAVTHLHLGVRQGKRGVEKRGEENAKPEQQGKDPQTKTALGKHSSYYYLSGAQNSFVLHVSPVSGSAALACSGKTGQIKAQSVLGALPSVSSRPALHYFYYGFVQKVF